MLQIASVGVDRTTVPLSTDGHASALPVRKDRHADYNKGSSSEGTLCRALFRPDVSLPPASARSGRPPPLPPTLGARIWISLPAWTLAVRSLVTPAMRT